MKSSTSRNSVSRATLLAATQLACSTPLFGATGTWTNNSASGLTWNTATSWSGGIIPNGIGDIANFTNDISANRLISLNGERTLGALNIGDSGSAFFNFTLNAGSPSNSTLIFDQTGVADASITVPDVGGVAANSIVAAYVLLKDNLAINTAFANSTTVQLAISSLIRDDAGSFGIIKSGPGIFQLAAPNTFEGGTTIQAGRINNNNLRAFGTGGVTVESGGQAFINTASSANNFTIAGTGYSNSADTAAQAGAIRLANNRVIQGSITLAGDARIGVDTTASAFIDGAISGSSNLEINSPTTTTGGVTLLRSSPALTGTVSVSRGSFNFPAALGGALNATAASGASVVLGTGTSIGGNLTLDSSSGAVSRPQPGRHPRHRRKSNAHRCQRDHSGQCPGARHRHGDPHDLRLHQRHRLADLQPSGIPRITHTRRGCHRSDHQRSARGCAHMGQHFHQLGVGSRSFRKLARR